MSRNLDKAWSPPILRGFLSGLILSTAGSSATFSVSAGMCADSNNADYISLESAISKTTSSWAVGSGNGGLDTGTIANSTWYHAYVIRRTDTGVVDALVSLSASAPTLPSGYTLARRLGAMKTNGSGQWTKFVQLGDEFLWDVSVVDANAVTPGVTTATTTTLTVPTGIQVWALLSGNVRDNTNAGSTLNVSSFDQSDQASSLSTAFTIISGPSSQNGGAPIQTRTNTSAQVRTRVSTTTAFFTLITNGWIDTRGRNG